MKKISLLFAIAFTSFNLHIKAQTIGEKSIIGTWLNNEKDGKIEVYQSGNKYFGKLIWGRTILDANGNSKKDTKNPDSKLKARDLLNAVILTDFVFNDGQWKDGKIYDPTNGKTYSSVMKLTANKLSIRGFVGISMFGRTTEWTRVN